MDHLAEVSRLARKFDAAKVKMEEAMEARNAAIRVARDERHGPGAIGEAAALTPEQVRRICNSQAGQSTYR
jgi:hypothetical protein